MTVAGQTFTASYRCCRLVRYAGAILWFGSAVTALWERLAVLPARSWMVPSLWRTLLASMATPSLSASELCTWYSKVRLAVSPWCGDRPGE